MTTETRNDIVSTDSRASALGRCIVAWFVWMTLFGVVGSLVSVGVHAFVGDQCERDLAQQCHAWMGDQADQLRRDEIDCLVNPDPAFIEELLADAALAAKVRDVYLGGDLSDPRLCRLCELPNLKCVVFLFARNHHALLERMDGMPTVEELTFSWTLLSSDDISHVAGFPHLRSLAFREYPLGSVDLRRLSGHPMLEQLAIDRATPDGELVSLLKAMPRLRECSIRVTDERGGLSQDAFQTLLNQTLPQCKCQVEEDIR
jgi:hypothetical protein